MTLTNEIMNYRKIGVEIETTGITREKGAKIIAKYFKTESYRGDTDDERQYDAWVAIDKKGRKWKVMYDGSLDRQRKFLSGERKGEIIYTRSTSYSAEVVTPILEYDEIPILQDILKKLEEGGAIVNRTCGVHIHIDGFKDTTKVKNLVNILSAKEDIIYDSLKIYNSRIEYCHKTNERFLNELNEKNPKTMEELKRIWYNTDNDNSIRYHIRDHYDLSRYTHCNLHALFTKGTIEFRLFNGTLDGTLIKAYIQFCLAVMNQADHAKGSKFKKSNTDNPKFEMRNWLRKMGLNGKEFADCRKVFLGNLKGNSAKRFA